MSVVTHHLKAEFAVQSQRVGQCSIATRKRPSVSWRRHR